MSPSRARRSASAKISDADSSELTISPRITRSPRPLLSRPPNLERKYGKKRHRKNRISPAATAKTSTCSTSRRDPKAVELDGGSSGFGKRFPTESQNSRHQR